MNLCKKHCLVLVLALALVFGFGFYTLNKSVTNDASDTSFVF